MNGLSASVRTVKGVSVIDLSGRITLGDSVAILRDTFRREADLNKKLLLNLANVNYVDSAGLGELVGCYTAMLNRRGAIKLCSMQPRLKELMQMTRLYTLFEVHEDEKSAIESFGA